MLTSVAPARVVSGDNPAYSEEIRSEVKRLLIAQHIAGQVSDTELETLIFDLDLASA